MDESMTGPLGIFLFVGLPLLIAGLSLLIGKLKIRHCEKIRKEGIRTTGTVKKLTERDLYKDVIVVYPTVAFYAESGYIEYETKYSYVIPGSNGPALKPQNSDFVDGAVYYLPKHPEEFIYVSADAYIKDIRSRSRALAVLLLIAAVFMAFGMLMRSLNLM